MAAVKCGIRRQTPSGCHQRRGSQPRSYDHILCSFLSNEWSFSWLTFSLLLFQFKLVYSSNPHAQIRGRTLWKTPDFNYLRLREFANRKGSRELHVGRTLLFCGSCLSPLGRPLCKAFPVLSILSFAGNPQAFPAQPPFLDPRRSCSVPLFPSKRISSLSLGASVFGIKLLVTKEHI